MNQLMSRVAGSRFAGNKIILIPVAIFLLAAGCSKSTPVVTTPPPVVVSDYKNTSYIIEGKTITLKDGLAENDIENSSSTKVTTKIFEANTQGDLNGDGLADTAVILTQNSGGSGTFYYAAAAIKTAQGYNGTNAIFMSDRIAPQNNQIQNNVLIVNYADRKPTEDFSISPSVGKSLYLEYFNNSLMQEPEALQVSSPNPYTEITSPLTITGQARGSWFFEASFPVILKDASGKIVAQGAAQTKSNWMTENFVPFTITLTFTNQTSKTTGTLTLKKDNPSGLPQNDALYNIPIIFK